MKRNYLFGLFMIASLMLQGQGSTIYKVDMLKPKPGMRDAFEASWKLHMTGYHSTSDKRIVYQVTSGPDNGCYVVVEGPFSYSDMDMVKANAKAHRIDLDKTILPKLEPGSRNFYAYWRDTLSRNIDAKAEKFLITNTVVKNGKMNEYLAEVRRGVLIQDKMNSPISTNRLTVGFAGSKPTLISIRNLKDGYKELEGGPNNPEFRSTYINVYGQEAWDNRTKIMVDLVESAEMHFQILRPDLSSK